MEYFDIFYTATMIISFFVIQPLLWVYIDHMEEDNTYWGELYLFKSECPMGFYPLSIALFLLGSILSPVIIVLVLVYLSISHGIKYLGVKNENS